jgi:O6-methylguanine-DNA--protein-cysteine methyltransferase
MPNRPTVPPLTSSQTKYVLEKLIDEGKVTAADVRRHISGMWSEMNSLERRLAELRAMAEPLRHPMRAIKGAAKKLTRAKRKISAKGRASYRLQGQYVAHIRQIPKGERARFKRMAKKDGREKAVAEMKKRLGK